MAATTVSKYVFSKPIIVILGATGTGKSKLAIELAKRFDGEVISADSMQVYKGLDIITNKVTDREQEGVPHHVMNFLNPLKGITVHQFRNMALAAIEEVEKKSRLPVVVGGTMYYIESILYDMLLEEAIGTDLQYDVKDPGSPERKKTKFSETEATNEEIYSQVKAVDPEMAEYLHPGDRRKSLRCLEVYHELGRKMSSLLKDQRSRPGGTDTGGPLRFSKAVILWIRCEEDTLNERLNRRVDKMIEDGLVKELLDFHEDYNRSRVGDGGTVPADYTRGIFQAIGFKEFHEYLILSAQERESDRGHELFRAGVENLKLVTRRYAKRQLKWIVNRFLRRGRRQIPPIYELDATDPSEWEKKVFAVAEEIVESRLQDRDPIAKPMPVTNCDDDLKTIHKCETCNRYLMGKVQYELHLKGARHRKMLRKLLRETNGGSDPITQTNT